MNRGRVNLENNLTSMKRIQKKEKKRNYVYMNNESIRSERGNFEDTLVILLGI